MPKRHVALHVLVLVVDEREPSKVGIGRDDGVLADELALEDLDDFGAGDDFRTAVGIEEKELGALVACEDFVDGGLILDGIEDRHALRHEPGKGIAVGAGGMFGRPVGGDLGDKLLGAEGDDLLTRHTCSRPNQAHIGGLVYSNGLARFRSQCHV